MRVAEHIYEVFKIFDLSTLAARATSYESIARIVFDVDKDRYFIEYPKWLTAGKSWLRDEKPYLVFKAALKVVMTPKPEPVVC
jgi:hypothetical protein